MKKKIRQVSFKDIIGACIFENVKEALLKLYPDQKRYIKEYRDTFETLMLTKPRYSKEGMVIDIKRVGRGKNAYFSVSGVCIENCIKQTYAIEYMAWSKWVGCEVDKQVLKKMSKEEIVAHCLWEMTFMGFTQNKIRKNLYALRKQAKDIEGGKVKTIPFEQAIRGLKDKAKRGRQIQI